MTQIVDYRYALYIPTFGIIVGLRNNEFLNMEAL